MATVSYLGDYMEGVFSGVPTMIGVATPIAFLETAPQGPTDRVAPVLDKSDFARFITGADYA